MFTMYSFFFLFFTVTVINNTMYSNYVIGNTETEFQTTNCHFSN